MFQPEGPGEVRGSRSEQYLRDVIGPAGYDLPLEVPAVDPAGPRVPRPGH